MVRRSFRVGLRFGLLFGVAAAVVKTVQAKRGGSSPPPAAPEPWTPATPPQPEPRAEDVAMDEAGLTPATIEPEPEPDVAAPEPAAPEVTEPDAVEPEAATPPLDEVGEPVMEPSAPDDDILPAGEGRRTASSRRAPAAKKAPAKKKAGTSRRRAPETAAPWVDPEGGMCPQSHPIKAKRSSRIFHLPGMFAYERTTPDRCYRSAEDAQSDGFRQALR